MKTKLLCAGIIALASIPCSASASIVGLERSLQAYSSNPSDEKAYNSAIQSATQIIADNKTNAACSVYTFGILQIVEGMPIFVSASNKSIVSLRSSKEESMAQVGPESGSRWDDLITQAQVEFQKGLIYRGDVIGRYFAKVKSFCK